MTKELPCIVCGTGLESVWLDMHQPYDGVMVKTYGNYGSTVFDSFFGNFLAFNICDNCLTEAANQGRVLLGRDRRPVTLEGIHIGWEKLPYSAEQWNPDMEEPYDTLDLTINDLVEDLPDSISINQDALTMALMIINRRKNDT